MRLPSYCIRKITPSSGIDLTYQSVLTIVYTFTRTSDNEIDIVGSDSFY